MPRPLAPVIPVVCLCLAACGDAQREADPEQQRQQQVAALLSPQEPPKSSVDIGFANAADLSQALSELPPGSEAIQTKYDNGRPQAQGFVNDDRPVGDWIYWHETGPVAARGRFLYGGKEDGLWTRWNDAGVRIQHGIYEEGVTHGEWWYWHDNGKPQSHGRYHFGKKIGHWTYWHLDGRRAAVGTYDNDRKSGTWRYYNRAGKLVNKTSYYVED